MIEDPEGTGVFVCHQTGTCNNWEIYGNTVRHTDQYIADGREGIAGLFVVSNDAGNTAYANYARIYNNTLVNIRGVYSGVRIDAGSNNKAKNNIWYDCATAGNMNVTSDYNWYYSTPSPDGGANTTNCTSNCDIFVNLSDDLRLSGSNLPAAGVDLGSPYNTDLLGNTRGVDGIWDRGALELKNGSSDSDQANLSSPANLRIIDK